MIIKVVFEFTDRQLEAIADQRDKQGLATREDCETWLRGITYGTLEVVMNNMLDPDNPESHEAWN